jgi:6,7-dimethyl-8-ribityllumazine synthase
MSQSFRRSAQRYEFKTVIGVTTAQLIRLEPLNAEHRMIGMMDHQFDILALTRIVPVQDSLHFANLSDLLKALHIAPGKGWSDDRSSGEAFLIPLGNLELVCGELPAECDTLIEVTGLTALESLLRRMAEGPDPSHRGFKIVGEVTPTHWNSRVLLVSLTNEITVGFWEMAHDG